uniref:cytochrome c oxidase subunit 2 n=1 Tax=Madagascaria erythrocladioides TaxID=753684 RepID=UPI001FCD2ED2|nr:cytochrome c oxidase subunit 2 [Madagascaria erythrocladioides]UNJ18794.1 cytochrome c oxidase subunit 2 [Madagascaria erythrocladioides]
MLFKYLISFNIFFIFFNNVKTYSDAPEKWQISFQDPATPVMEGVISLHHDLMFFLCIISVFVTWILYRTLWLFNAEKNSIPYPLIHGTQIELAWTITPSLILIAIAIPSFALLYALDEIIDPTVTIKAIGHQWYLRYEYADYINEDGNNINYDSYMLPEEDLELGYLRMLEVDNHVVVPVNTHIRLIISSADVLHSFAVPSLGIKTDAVPGRLNQSSLFIKREGLYYGQCGVNHATMPIVIEAVNLKNYVNWIFDKIHD